MHARLARGEGQALNVTAKDTAHQISMSTPSVGEAGHTGDWRSNRPVLVARETCLAVKAGKVTCQLCWIYCPDACISRSVGPEFDLDYCKGCGICAQVCPAGAIEMQPEAQHGVCEIDETEARVPADSGEDAR